MGYFCFTLVLLLLLFTIYFTDMVPIAQAGLQLPMWQRITLSPWSLCFPAPGLRLQACATVQVHVIVWHSWSDPFSKRRDRNNTNVYLTSEARSLTQISVQSWCWQAAFPPGGSRKQPSPCLFQLQGLAVFLGSFNLRASKGRLSTSHTDLHVSLARPL